MVRTQCTFVKFAMGTKQREPKSLLFAIPFRSLHTTGLSFHLRNQHGGPAEIGDGKNEESFQSEVLKNRNFTAGSGGHTCLVLFADHLRQWQVVCILSPWRPNHRPVWVPSRKFPVWALLVLPGSDSSQGHLSRGKTTICFPFASVNRTTKKGEDADIKWKDMIRKIWSFEDWFGFTIDTEHCVQKFSLVNICPEPKQMGWETFQIGWLIWKNPLLRVFLLVEKMKSGWLPAVGQFSTKFQKEVTLLVGSRIRKTCT